MWHPYLLDVWYHKAIAGGHGHADVVAVVLQQRPTPWLQAGVEGGVPAQANAEGLDDKGQVRELGTCRAQEALLQGLGGTRF
jgi:hypothetical protein